MKNVTIALLLVVVTIVSVFLVRSYRQNIKAKSEVAELEETVESYKCLVESRDESLTHSRLGTAVLCRMALKDTRHDVFNFLDMTPVGSLNCKAIDLAESPATKLIWYSQKLEYNEGEPILIKTTKSLLKESKSVLFVVDFNSFEIVDHVMIKNFVGVSGKGPPPYQYQVSCNLPNGTRVKYKVLATGFERIQ